MKCFDDNLTPIDKKTIIAKSQAYAGPDGIGPLRTGSHYNKSANTRTRSSRPTLILISTFFSALNNLTNDIEID